MSEHVQPEDFNEVSITVNGEVVAKASGPSPFPQLLSGLVDEIRRKSAEHKGCCTTDNPHVTCLPGWCRDCLACDPASPVHQPAAVEQPERHSFMVMNSKTDVTCVKKGCGQTREGGNHYTAEDIEKILERRRAIMPGYDEALKEWLS